MTVKETTPVPDSLAGALAALQSRLPPVSKDKTAKAGTYTYDYADLATVSAAIMPLMGSLGLSFSASPTLTIGEHQQFVLLYTLRHVSGQEIGGSYPLPDPARTNAQQVGSAITYARRYCLCAITGVAPENEDDDGRSAARATPAWRPAREPEPAAEETGDQAPGIATPERVRAVLARFRAAPPGGLGMSDITAIKQAIEALIDHSLGDPPRLTAAECDFVEKAVAEQLQEDEDGEEADDAREPGGS